MKRLVIRWRAVFGVAVAIAAITSVVTVVQAQSTKADYDLISSGRVTGLYRTGVNDSNQKLGENTDDPHWIIDRVIRPTGMNEPPCQFAHRGGTNLVSIPTISSTSPIPARTITERPNEAGYVTSRNPQITGDASADDTGVRNLNGTSPWKFNVNNARWIGQNLYGQNFTSRSCKDPTNKNPKRMADANIYVFKLRGGFKIDDRVDLASVKLRLAAAVDNTIKVVVNGTTVPARLIPSQNTAYREVNEPGFARNSPSIETQVVSGIFKDKGERNELELMIQSTYSHTGLLIKNIEMTGRDQGGATDFNLVPSVNVGGHIVMPGQSTTATPGVRNTGHASSSNVQWQLTKFSVQRGDTSSYPTTTQETRGTPERHYGHDAQSVAGGTRIFTVGAASMDGTEGTVNDYPVGTKICYATSVKPYSDASAAAMWRHSAPECVILGKKPQVHIEGGDLRVGSLFETGMSIPRLSSNVNTSISTRAGKTFGSWVEYGITAPGRVANTASASGIVGGNTESGQARWSKLTFANTPQFGEFSSDSPYIPNVRTAIEGAYDVEKAPNVSGAVQLTPAIKGMRVATADITLNSYTFNTPGQTVIIYAPEHTVTINGDITYGGMSLSSAKDIPQMVIIADQIRIQSGVTKVDGWLVADGELGKIDTCANAPADLSVAVCNAQLVVNGPVMAKQLLLRRTAGAEAGDDVSRALPAETFNLRPDAYIWALHNNTDYRRVLTTYTKELPPRF